MTIDIGPNIVQAIGICAVLLALVSLLALCAYITRKG